MVRASRVRRTVDIRIKRHVINYFDERTGVDIEKPKETVESESIRKNIDLKEAVRLMIDELPSN